MIGQYERRRSELRLASGVCLAASILDPTRKAAAERFQIVGEVQQIRFIADQIQIGLEGKSPTYCIPTSFNVASH